MRESIEDRIIAYFDGRMTDHESAELLHRVSVSPEIRKLFREHEMLRELARSAQASAVVRPELEADLFSRIEALAAAEQAPVAAPIEEEQRRRAIPLFWTRWRLGLATALGAFILGTAITLGPELFDNTNSTDDQQRTTNEQLKTSNSTEASDVVTKEDIMKNDIAIDNELPNKGSKTDFNKVIRGNRDYEARQATNERPAALGNGLDKSYSSSEPHRSDENSVGANAIAEGEAAIDGSTQDMTASQQISAVDAKSGMPLNLGGEKGNLPIFRAEDLEEPETQFEMALETSTGFAYPADAPGVQPFADQRISGGYFLDRKNIVGIRLSTGLFEVLPEQSTTFNGTYTNVARNLETERRFSYGAYYTHREYGVLTDLINLDLSLGAGKITDGYTISGEIGLRLPITAISSKLFFAPSFSLTRVHIDARSMDEITNSVSSDGPVLIEGSDIENTINGRIHYGISYQF